MALCDMTTMFSYMVFSIRFGFLVDVEQPPFGFTLPWICFLLLHVVCSIALRTVSIYLSVVTAYIRYHAMDKLASKWMMAASARPIFLVILMLVGLTSIPTFLIHGIVEVDPTLSQNESLYTIIIPELALANECLLFKSNLWLTGILFKKLNECRKNHQLLKLSNGGSEVKRVYLPDRTTKMLIILLMIFLFTELPQGFLAILNGMFPNDIHQYIYLSVGEMLDLLSLINCNVCFIVYPCISSHYRQTFRIMLHRIRWWPNIADRNLVTFTTTNGRFATAAIFTADADELPRDSDEYL
uniref:G-protein coupled receptors family 1 profile domain-containing protein n=1 Tax=Parascaris equorum TaxID=6256 RepID=A0A914RR20_PAREQ